MLTIVRQIGRLCLMVYPRIIARVPETLKEQLVAEGKHLNVSTGRMIRAAVALFLSMDDYKKRALVDREPGLDGGTY